MRTRLLLSFLVLAAFVLVLVELPLGLTYAGRLQDRLLSEVERDARILSSLVEEQVEQGDLAGAAATVDRYEARTGARVVVTDQAGTSLVDTGNAPTGRDFSTRPEFRAALGGTQASGIRSSRTLGQELAYVAVPVTSNGQVTGALRVSFPTDRLREEVRENWLRLGLLSVLVLAAAGSLGWVVAGWAVAPVAQLEDGARRLAGGDLSARVRIERGPPELRRLGEDFDDMADRLESLMASQRSFVADASHQLRTPLTALRLRLDGLADQLDPPGGGAPDLDEVGGELDAVMGELDRLGRLVEGLLALARTDTAAPARTELDVGAALRELATRWTDLAAERDVRLEVDPGEGLRATAVAGTLDQVLDDLLDNATEVAPPGTSIELTATRERDAVVVGVRDHGPGLDDEGLARATDRFWRGPGSHPGGTGLGLAIADELVRASGGSLRLRRPAEGTGLLVEVRLVAAGAATPTRPADRGGGTPAG
ncbi:MAG: ATP-binding protein [Microthrixaceae bacterium]